MDEGDRANIHEVMEQQTVSIAKAGITTTLNTRTTILAAANPAYGRWNRRRSPGENINMPPALLSRFDVMWLLLDECDAETDARLAQHIIGVHQGRVGAAAADTTTTTNAAAGASTSGNNTSTSPPLLPESGPLPPRLLRAYIALARRHAPAVPPELTDYIAAHYVDARGQEAAELGDRGAYVTPRTLMSILRLAQAVAKLRFDDRVIRSDVDAAIALMRASQASIEPELQKRAREDPVSRLYLAVRDQAVRDRAAAAGTGGGGAGGGTGGTGGSSSAAGYVDLATIRTLATTAAGITGHNVDEIVDAAVEEYAQIAVWTVERDARTGAVRGVRFEEADLALA